MAHQCTIPRDEVLGRIPLHDSMCWIVKCARRLDTDVKSCHISFDVEALLTLKMRCHKAGEDRKQTGNEALLLNERKYQIKREKKHEMHLVAQAAT